MKGEVHAVKVKVEGHLMKDVGSVMHPWHQAGVTQVTDVQAFEVQVHHARVSRTCSSSEGFDWLIIAF